MFYFFPDVRHRVAPEDVGHAAVNDLALLTRDVRRVPDVLPDGAFDPPAA
ncbi:MAG TPA: hypothetical protein VIU11_14530 [Nakamurella sp.]